jgi:hypothetical protein
MTFDSTMHEQETGCRKLRHDHAGDRRSAGLLVYAVQSLLFLLLFLQADWAPSRQPHTARNHPALSDTQPAGNALVDKADAPRAIVSSNDRQRAKARIGDTPEGLPPGNWFELFGPEGRQPSTGPYLAHSFRILTSAYSARAPPFGTS